MAYADRNLLGRLTDILGPPHGARTRHGAIDADAFRLAGPDVEEETIRKRQDQRGARDRWRYQL